MKKLITCSSGNIKGRRFESSLMTHVLTILPHMYVYHTCTHALHMTSPVANRSIVVLGATFQKNKHTPKAILVMHALSGADTVIATYNMGKQLVLKALADDLHADLDEVCSSEIWRRKDCVQGCN